MDRWEFYEKNITKFLNKDSKILIISASSTEVNFFQKNFYTDFYASYFGQDQKNEILKGSLINENNILRIDLTENNFHLKEHKFDYIIVHAVIHHLDKPHTSILNLYDIATKGIVIIESNDSLLMKVCTKLKFVEEFEYSAISKNKGGLLDSSVPNYIYRWSEREIKKLIYSYKPNLKHEFIFDYNFDFKNKKLYETGNFYKKIMYKLSNKFLFFFNFFLKKQANNLFIFIKKT
jgi:hypothetical protein